VLVGMLREAERRGLAHANDEEAPESRPLALPLPARYDESDACDHGRR
jgi:hypothetical protein